MREKRLYFGFYWFILKIIGSVRIIKMYNIKKEIEIERKEGKEKFMEI